jgi:hypothetical protein
MGVGGVGITHETQVRGYGIRYREEEEAPIIKNEFSLEINKRGA